MRDPAEMQYRPQQARQGQFSPIFIGPHDYPQTTKASSKGQPSPPASPIIGMAQFQTQSFEPRTREKKIIQIKDPNSNKDVTQKILNRQPSWSLTSTTGSSSSSAPPDISGQSSSPSTLPLSRQQDAEGNVRALASDNDVKPTIVKKSPVKINR